MRLRPGDQPLPAASDGPLIHDLVAADLKSRQRLGIERYGTPLQPGNGRSALRDLYEELLDAACYTRQLIEEGNVKLTLSQALQEILDIVLPEAPGLVKEDIDAIEGVLRRFQLEKGDGNGAAEDVGAVAVHRYRGAGHGRCRG